MAKEKENPSKKSEEGNPMTLEEVLKNAAPQLEKAIKGLPADKVAGAKKEVDKIFSGDLSWGDLAQYTPDRLMKIAEMGFNQFNLGQYDSAERLFKGLTVIDPENYYYHQMLGATFQRKEKYPEAVLEYSIAVDLNKKDMVSLTNRGECFFKLNVFEMANADFDAAIALDPKGDDKWANRARMLREQIKLMKKGKK